MSVSLSDAGASESFDSLAQLRDQLMRHPLYDAVQTIDNLRLFMREHVFAVWDFMSLLKRLQQIVTCCELPWRPAADASLARFINEIVLGEECDHDGRGGYLSHFELYLSAMDEVEASTTEIREFLSHLGANVPVETALERVSMLPSTREFVSRTLHLTAQGQPHEIAAAFFHGREDVIPEMFDRLVQSLPAVHGTRVDRLKHYLERHIEVDADDHGPLAQKLVNRLCEGNPQKEAEARETATRAISQRISLWDGILNAIEQSRA